MIDHSDEILIDFLSEADDYYDKVQEGIEQIKDGMVSLGIDAVFRPIHTIKGTSGFIPGLDKLAEFAHKTEDFMKEIQSGEVKINANISDLLIRAVDEVFNMIEQIKNGVDDLDNETALEVAKGIDAVGEGVTFSSDDQGEALKIEEKNGFIIFRINMERIHLPSQFKLISEKFEGTAPDSRIVLDLTNVRTIGSTAWGAIWKAGEKNTIFAFGLSEACQTVFYRWNFNQFIKDYESEDSFWKNVKKS